MSFQNPSAFLWALPLFAAIVMLYLLRMRRRDVKVPASFLWPERTEEIRANALIQRLRPNLLMFLQLVAVALAVSALAGPQTRQIGLAGEVTVIVVDTSASMQATDIKPSRFAEAVRLAEESIRSAKPTDRLALIEAGPTPRVIFPLGRDTERQIRALRTVRPTDADGDMGEALRLAAALVGGIEGARIVLLSDGDFEPVTNFSRGKASVVYREIGRSGDNLAISGFGLAEVPGGRELYCGVRNFSQAAMEAELSIYGDGKLIDSVAVPKIGTGQIWGKTLKVNASIKVFEAKLTAADILKADNYAVALANPGATLRVLLVGKSDPFLERALALDSRVVLDKAESSGALQTGRYDLVIFDGVTEQPTESRGVLTLGVAGPPSPVVQNGTRKLPRFIDAESADLLKGVDFRSIYLEQQAVVTPKAIGKVLAQSSAGPLIVTADRPGKRQVYVAFEPLDSDWPLQFSFPIFVANVLDFLGGSGSSNTLLVRPGAPFVIPTSSPLNLDGPDLRTKVSPSGGAATVRDILRTGKYKVSGDKINKTVYATMRSDRESNVVPVASIDLGSANVKSTPNPVRFADFWRPLALLCLGLLGLEWWIFARRS